MLELIDIKKRYGSKEVLHGISIKFENGIYGLIGPNGSGKSTIMNIMSDVLDMSEYSCAITPQVRQAGNRLSGLTETAYASLLA